MEYRGVEYTVVQGVERGVWKWTASVTNLLIMGKSRPSLRSCVFCQPFSVSSVKSTVSQ